MRRFLALLTAGIGLGGLLARRRWRRRVEPQLDSSPAEELRAKLDATRTAEPTAAPEPELAAEPEPATEPELVADPVDEPTASELEARRRGVHERAREALDELA